MPHHDYVPRSDSQFESWFENLKSYVLQKTSGTLPAWSHIPAEAVSQLSDYYTAWNTAYKETTKPHAKPQTDAKNEARDAAEVFVRGFVNQYLRFPPVTDSDRNEMQIHNRDVHPTRTDEPDTPPEWSVRSNGLYRLRFEIRPAGAERPHIPGGYNGAVIRYIIADEPVTDAALLRDSALLSRGYSDMQFGQEADGKYLSATLEWETHTNLHGPKSAPQSIKIR